MNRITVVTANRTGLIAEISHRLAAHRINIDSANGRVVGDDAVLSLEVDEAATALTVLTQAGFQVVSDDVVILQVEDVPGALAKVAEQLSGHQLDIRVVRTISRSGGCVVVAIGSDDNARVRTLLADRLLA